MQMKFWPVTAVSITIFLNPSPAISAEPPTKISGEYDAKTLKKNTKDIDEMINSLDRDKASKLKGILSSEEIKVLVTETEIQMDYVDARLSDGGGMPRTWIDSIRRYSYSLSSIELCGQLHFAAGAFIEKRGSKELSGRLQVLARKWCAHATALGRLYEFRDIAQRHGEAAVR